MGILFTILLMVLVFKVTGFFLRIFGKLLGCLFGVIGYILVGVLAIAGLGIAAAFLPVIIIAGIVGIAGLAAKAV